MKMRTLAKLVGSLAVAVLLAYLTVDYSLDRPGSYIHNGPWKTNLATGSSAAGIHHRARIALHGLWALASTEVVYFHATTDTAGNRLEYDHTYRIEGIDPDTRWWSLTAYIDDHFIPNQEDRYSFSQTTVDREPEGSWVIMLSHEPQEKNWLPTGDRPGMLTLSLRCYNPGTRMRDEPAGVTLPKIIRAVSP